MSFSSIHSPVSFTPGLLAIQVLCSLMCWKELVLVVLTCDINVNDVRAVLQSRQWSNILSDICLERELARGFKIMWYHSGHKIVVKHTVHHNCSNYPSTLTQNVVSVLWPVGKWNSFVSTLVCSGRACVSSPYISYWWYHILCIVMEPRYVLVLKNVRFVNIFVIDFAHVNVMLTLFQTLWVSLFKSSILQIKAVINNTREGSIYVIFFIGICFSCSVPW